MDDPERVCACGCGTVVRKTWVSGHNARSSQHPCKVDECETPANDNGYCKLHATRWRRHGDPLVVKKVGRPPGYDKAPGTYFSVHARLRKRQGSARTHVCPCGSPAQQWAYDHCCPNEQTSEWGPFTEDLSHYFARCVPCHKRMDLERLGKSAS